jgi:hypothetical protein
MGDGLIRPYLESTAISSPTMVWTKMVCGFPSSTKKLLGIWKLMVRIESSQIIALISLLPPDAHLYSPYGLLRSPWNWNPDPHLARYNNLNQIEDITGIAGILTKDYKGVHCSDYESFVQRLVGQPWSVFLEGLEDDVHGKFHFTLGGQGGPYCYAQVPLR